MSALPPRADILTQRITDPKTEIAAKYSQELIDYLASDHRAARDLGITIYDVDNFCR